MKMVVTILQERDRVKVSEALAKDGYFFTKIASSGGFLREGNVTLLIGVDDEKLDDALRVIGENSKEREQLVCVPEADIMATEAMLQAPVNVKVGGAVAFVFNVERFERW